MVQTAPILETIHPSQGELYPQQAQLTLVPPAPAHSPAPIGARALAFGVDIVIIGVTTALLSNLALMAYQIIARKSGLPPLFERNVFHVEFFKEAVGLIVFCTYMTLNTWYRDGQTVGKKIMHLRSVRNDGSEWTLRSSLFRALTYQISYITLGFGFALCMLRNDSKTLHDILSASQVRRETV